VASIIPLALAAALYPTLLAGVIVLLARDEPVRMLAAFLAGGVLISLASGLVIVFALGGAVSTNSQNSASPTIDIVAGVLSLGLAAVLHQRMRERERGVVRTSKKKKDGPSWTQRTLGEGSAWAAFGAGLLLNLPGIWYLDALKDISQGNPGTATAVVEVVVFIVIMFVLAEFPLIGYVVAPEATQVRVTGFQTWMSRNAMTVATWAAALIGAYLTVKGIANAI
jgi:hypothetical protein